jgi:hypothetical protein
MAYQPKKTISEVRSFLRDGVPLLNKSINLPGITPAVARFDKSRGKLANVYRTPYPLLPSQIGPSSAITRPFSASFLPTLFPPSLLESTHLASPSTPSNRHPAPPMRYNSQHHRAQVYFPPRGDTPAIWASRSAMSSSLLLSPTREVSSPSNTWFESSPGNGIYSTTPPLSVSTARGSSRLGTAVATEPIIDRSVLVDGGLRYSPPSIDGLLSPIGIP